MKLESEPRQRCAECGAQQPHMIRMERGGPYCRQCLFTAWDTVWGRLKQDMPLAKPGEYGYCPPLSRKDLRR